MTTGLKLVDTRRKVANYYPDHSPVYDLIVGCAGDTAYSTMTSQKIRDAVSALAEPTLASIKDRQRLLALGTYCQRPNLRP